MQVHLVQGGLFELVSGANFFGEILEWAGFALAAWSLPTFAFAFFTFCNTGLYMHAHSCTVRISPVCARARARIRVNEEPAVTAFLRCSTSWCGPPRVVQAEVRGLPSQPEGCHSIHLVARDYVHAASGCAGRASAILNMVITCA
ncbi:hypothetical protein EON66_06025 [archaeon]|nr:MAG: hypothetical protein EON66_06025 [archaeon]